MLRNKCYSLGEKAEKDNLRRIECVSERRDKGLQDCGMVYTAPSSTDSITLNKWGGPRTLNVTGGFFSNRQYFRTIYRKKSVDIFFGHKTRKVLVRSVEVSTRLIDSV